MSKNKRIESFIATIVRDWSDYDLVAQDCIFNYVNEQLKHSDEWVALHRFIIRSVDGPQLWKYISWYVQTCNKSALTLNTPFHSVNTTCTLIKKQNASE